MTEDTKPWPTPSVDKLLSYLKQKQTNIQKNPEANKRNHFQKNSPASLQCKNCSSRNVWIDTSTFSTLRKDSGSSLYCPFPYPHAKIIYFPFCPLIHFKCSPFQICHGLQAAIWKTKVKVLSSGWNEELIQARREGKKCKRKPPCLLSTIVEIVDTRYGYLGFTINYRMIPWILSIISGTGYVLQWLYSIPSAFLVLQTASLALSEWSHSSGTQIWTKMYSRVVLKLDKLWVPGQWSSAATEDIKRSKQESLEIMTREMCTSSSEVCMSCSVTTILFSWLWLGWSYICKCSAADKQSAISLHYFHLSRRVKHACSFAAEFSNTASSGNAVKKSSLRFAQNTKEILCKNCWCLPTI